MPTRFMVAICALATSIQVHAQQPAIASDAEEILSALVEKVQSSQAITAEFKTAEKVFSAGQVVFEQKTDYSSASALPNKYALRVRSEEVNADIVSNGETMYLLVAPEAYIQKDSPESLDEVTTEAGMPSGPIIDALLALTVPTESVRKRLLKGVTKVSLVKPKAQRDSEESSTGAVLRFEREDLSILDITVADGDVSSMKVDMTELIKRSNPQTSKTPGFAFHVEVNVVRWEWNEGDEKTFVFEPPKDSKAYASVDALVKAMSGGPHPLIGREAPGFEVALMDDSKIKLSQHRDNQIVILDFWATWCGPCRMAMPVITEVAEKFKDKGVVLYAVNSGESKSDIKSFLVESKLPITVARDESQNIAVSYRIEGLPSTVLIGKDGRVENIHTGFQSLDGLREQLTTELQVLVDGGHLYEVDDSDSGDNQEK